MGRPAGVFAAHLPSIEASARNRARPSNANPRSERFAFVAGESLEILHRTAKVRKRHQDSRSQVRERNQIQVMSFVSDIFVNVQIASLHIKIREWTFSRQSCLSEIAAVCFYCAFREQYMFLSVTNHRFASFILTLTTTNYFLKPKYPNPNANQLGPGSAGFKPEYDGRG